MKLSFVHPVSLARHLFLLLVLGVHVVGCGGGGQTATAPTSEDPPSPTVTTVVVTPTTFEVRSSESVQLSAEVRDQHGNVMSGVSVSWETSSSSRATVSSTGLVTGKLVGAVKVTAVAAGRSGTAEGTVLPGPAVSVAVEPETVTFLTSDVVPLVARVRDGEGNEVTDVQVAWSSSLPEIVEVDGEGRVRSNQPATATVTATVGDLSAEAEVTVRRGTGTRVGGMEVYDRLITELMQRHGIKGGSVAVLRRGRLVLARGYGWADEGGGEEVTPESRFRIASVSKPITVAAIKKLERDGKLDLDAKAFAFLDDLPAVDGVDDDPRIHEITVRDLLEHEGGWDRAESFDPMFRSWTIADHVGTARPADLHAIIRYMRDQPLQFDPGARYAYSNFGYALLGEIIERVSGRPYVDFVQDEVLAPAGITRMVQGRTRSRHRHEDEVRYYDDRTRTSVFPGEGTVPIAYGGFYLEPMIAHGGWVASSVDLARFLAAEHENARPVGRVPGATSPSDGPSGPVAAGPSRAYAWGHGGYVPGQRSAVRYHSDGPSWALLFNGTGTADPAELGQEMNELFRTAADRVTAWPDHDLFGEYR